MGEEEKKMEEKKAEEGKAEKKEEPKADDKKEDTTTTTTTKAEESKDSPPPPPPPPQEIVLKVYMHCEGCARKVRRCLKGFPGVEEVVTDCKTQKVVVKGDKADPLKVVERVQRKSHRKVELLSPIPPPPAAEDEKKKEEKEAPKPEEKKQEPQVITLVLKVHMHCEACSQEIKRRILRMNGVENVEPDLKSSQVTVKGVFDPPKLVEYIYKKTGKHAVVVKQEPPEKKEEEKPKEEEEKAAADDGGGGDKDAKKGGKEEPKEKKDSGGGEAATAAVAEGEGEAANLVEMRKNEFYYNYPQNYYQIYPYPQRFEYQNYPPQMFSDENPNACFVM